VSATICLTRIARGGVVVACTDPPLFSICAAIACRLSGARLVNWLQDLFPEVASAVGVVRPGGRIDAGLRRLRDRSLRAAALNVAPGERMAAYMLARGVTPAAVRVIPNWADGKEIRPVPRDANPLRQRWDLAGRFVVGYSGNMGRAHEFRTMLDAAVRLRDRPDICFLLVGDGHQRSWIEAEAHRLGLANVMFQHLQPKEQLADSLGAADVHLVSLLPELEGFVVPSKFYAAAAAGRPVLFVGDPDGEVARLVVACDCGATVAPDDGAALAMQIQRLADDPALHATLAANARRAFEVVFNQDAATATWGEALRAIVEVPRPKLQAGGMLVASDG
jgi:glycosyltransferase involved in cell wall biosynthesis